MSILICNFKFLISLVSLFSFILCRCLFSMSLLPLSFRQLISFTSPSYYCCYLLSAVIATLRMSYTYDNRIWTCRSTKQLVKHNKRSQLCGRFHNEASFNFVSNIHSHLFVYNHVQASSIVLRFTSIYQQQPRSIRDERFVRATIVL
jgi:hypothetical protein